LHFVFIFIFISISSRPMTSMTPFSIPYNPSPTSVNGLYFLSKSIYS
jgi:hypothetical protein